MPRQKMPRFVRVLYPNSLIFVSDDGNRGYPAIDAIEEDGRRVYVTFRPVHGEDTLENRVRRMHALADAIRYQADRLKGG